MAPTSSVRRSIERAPAGERRALLLDHVRSEVEAVLGWDGTERIDVRQGFFDLGMDSLQATELRNRLQRSLDCTLPATLTMKFPTAAALASYLATLLFADGDEGVATPIKPIEARAAKRPLIQSDIQTNIDRELAKLEKLLGAG